jgi:hypothetical protein
LPPARIERTAGTGTLHLRDRVKGDGDSCVGWTRRTSDLEASLTQIFLPLSSPPPTFFSNSSEVRVQIRVRGCWELLSPSTIKGGPTVAVRGPTEVATGGAHDGGGRVRDNINDGGGGGDRDWWWAGVGGLGSTRAPSALVRGRRGGEEEVCGWEVGCDPKG